MENSTKYAKAMILRMQESKNQWLRSFEETINSMQSKLRQANNMYGHLNNQFRHVVAANWFLHARIASQEETIQKDQGIYEKLLKEYANLKSKISEEHCRQSHIEPDRLSADQSNDEIDDRSRNVGGEMILRQQLDQMTREYNEHLQKLKTENELLEKNQLQVHECYTKEIKQTEVEIKKLLRELKASRTRELLAIAKSPEDMMKICVKNEQTLVKEMDLISQDVAQKENEIKELNLSLKSVEYQSNEDRIKLLRQLQRKKGTIVILKKQKHLLHTRLNTVQESVELLKQEVTTGVISEPSQKLKQLIEIDVQLEQDYKRTQQDLQNHERRCSEHGVATPVNVLHVLWSICYHVSYHVAKIKIYILLFYVHYVIILQTV
ncbi:hypothetical protein DPMN_157505 [Dreissena polymorpha]|uniref:Uncharacterized protein n=1 Tax=Dreissena polymorpha TaxID=45954 RepID=A0A9D4EKG9_DREPO|nr:hypothetical protein DPMN_157505 [Dreissena polymorpha]